MNSVRRLIRKRLDAIWIKRCNVFVVLPVFFVLSAGYSSTCFSGIIYSDGFENGFKSYNTGIYKSNNHCCDHSLTLCTTNDGCPVNTGYYAFRSLVLQGDPAIKGHTARAELSGYNANTEAGEPIENWYEDRWYGFSVFIPDRGQGHYYAGAGQFFQFHQYAVGGSGTPFGLLMTTIDGIPQWTGVGTNGSWVRYFKTDATDDLGKWAHFIIQVNWGKGNGWVGKLKVWKNGVLVMNEDPWYNNTFGHEDDRPPYVKLGIDYPVQVDDYPMLAYHDNYVVGDENSSLAEIMGAMEFFPLKRHWIPGVIFLLNNSFTSIRTVMPPSSVWRR